jgi:hypothetical protein
MITKSIAIENRLAAVRIPVDTTPDAATLLENIAERRRLSEKRGISAKIPVAGVTTVLQPSRAQGRRLDPVPTNPPQ